MPSCPHCSEEIDKLPGFLSQEEHRKRLKSKDAKIKAAEDRAELAQRDLVDLREKAGDVDTLRAERDDFAAKLQAIETRQERTEAIAAAGLDASLADRLDVVYRAHAASLEEGEEMSFGDWLEGPAREDVLLAPHFASQESGTPPKAPTPPRTPDPPPGRRVTTPVRRQTSAELEAYFRSEQYRALPRDKQREEMARLQAEHAAASHTEG